MELKQGRPQEKRISKEERVYDLLEKGGKAPLSAERPGWTSFLLKK